MLSLRQSDLPRMMCYCARRSLLSFVTFCNVVSKTSSKSFYKGTRQTTPLRAILEGSVMCQRGEAEKLRDSVSKAGFLDNTFLQSTISETAVSN